MDMIGMLTRISDRFDSHP